MQLIKEQARDINIFQGINKIMNNLKKFTKMFKKTNALLKICTSMLNSILIC